jgi:calpain-15
MSLEQIEDSVPEGEKWTDPDFPPEFKSLSPEWTYESFLSKEEFEKWKTLTWRRASDIPCLQNDWGETNVIKEGIRPGDIKQGNIGDCYLLSSIAALAEEEFRTTYVFENPFFNKKGVYGVKLYVNGVK